MIINSNDNSRTLVCATYSECSAALKRISEREPKAKYVYKTRAKKRMFIGQLFSFFPSCRLQLLLRLQRI